MKRREHLGTAPAPSSAPPPYARNDSGVRERLGATNLALAPTRFVGRRRELSELRTLLTEHALVTVVGPAGIGKTRLASELARALLDEYAGEGGVWRVDLSEARDGEGVRAATARALGVGIAPSDHGGKDPLGASLAARGKMLVVLDGADGCGPALGRALGEWLVAAPAARWIVTARTRLGIEREAAMQLGPLATAMIGGGAPDAVWLYVDRARAGRLDLVLDDRTSQEILELVRRLGGVPLAIELAAARGSAAVPPRPAEPGPAHPPLRDAVAAAWEALEPRERDALAQLSVFAGSFDLDGAEAVLDLSAHAAPRAEEAVGVLRARALVGSESAATPRGRPRFTLPSAVRELARERLAEVGGRDAATLRHARHFVTTGLVWARRHDEGRTQEALAWLVPEADNLLAVHRRFAVRARSGGDLALGAALALDPLLATFGPASLRLSLLDAALSAAEGDRVEDERRVRALEARADAHRVLAHGAEALADAQAALTLATSCGARAAVGRVLRTLATLALTQGKLGEARGLLERAFEIDRETGDRREEGRALGALGSVAALEGRLDVASSTLERAIGIHHEVGDLRFEAIDAGNLAVVAHDAGRLTEARTFCERALAVCREAGNVRLEAEVVGLQAAVAHEEDRAVEARRLYERALAMHREVGNRRAEGVLLGTFGALLAESDDVEGARAAYARALTILRECRDRPDEALVLGALSAVEAREGCLESARAAMAHATECIEGVHEPRARTALHLWRGHLELALAREARAEQDEGRAQMLLEAARQRLLGTDPAAPGEVRRAADVRLARRALQRALDGSSLAESGENQAAPASFGPPPGAPRDALVVCAKGTWFRMPNGEVVSIARWRPLQRLLQRLAERREIAPGEPLSVEALVSAGWPGERMLPKAGATRVYTAVASLRRLGLRDVLVRDERGYLLRTDVGIARVSSR